MTRQRPSMGFLGRFGWSSDLRQLDDALRALDLHPNLVAEPVKITAVNLLKDHAAGTDPPAQSYRAAAEIVAISGHQVRAVLAAVQDGGEEVFLGAEIAGHQGGVDAHVAGDVTHADVVVALAREAFAQLSSVGFGQLGGVGVSRASE